MFCNGAQRERERGGGEGRGGEARARGIIATTNVSFGVPVVAQTMLARKRQEQNNKTNRTKTSMGLVGR
jgi:hypothetical protein